MDLHSFDIFEFALTFNATLSSHACCSPSVSSLPRYRLAQTLSAEPVCRHLQLRLRLDSMAAPNAKGPRPTRVRHANRIVHDYAEPPTFGSAASMSSHANILDGEEAWIYRLGSA